MDIDALIRFAKAYAGLGDAVTEQLDDLLSGDFDGINPNAVELIRDRLGGMNSEIDEAVNVYLTAAATLGAVSLE